MQKNIRIICLPILEIQNKVFRMGCKVTITRPGIFVRLNKVSFGGFLPRDRHDWSDKNLPNTASRTITGITLALPARASVMHPISGKVRRSHGGGSRRVFKQFLWLEANSVKAALSRPTPPDR